MVKLKSMTIIFFDVDEDGKPELGVKDSSNQYFFKYDSEMEKCILWDTIEGSWEQWFGSLKLGNPWGADSICCLPS